MTVNELKKKLINKIDQINDNEILEDIYGLILAEEADNDIYILSDEQIKDVEEGQKQYREGKYITGEESDKEIDEWLGN